jgi:hypothetical protein
MSAPMFRSGEGTPAGRRATSRASRTRGRCLPNPHRVLAAKPDARTSSSSATSLPTGDGQDRNEVLELGKAATAVQCRLEGSLSP